MAGLRPVFYVKRSARECPALCIMHTFFKLDIQEESDSVHLEQGASPFSNFQAIGRIVFHFYDPMRQMETNDVGFLNFSCTNSPQIFTLKKGFCATCSKSVTS
ncbi:hypothetical protein AVEN_224562-1 [Araneus ventricosus]|uniref:Uncharacterized protein n=1 Tax=Araneus ventricosus TaxID=182803 RepID=A0A4Y2U4D4_ARAVE|nr:hypothetical protein AVEN_83643-1 [Araneus ventricosus]GBO07835.1 hypothetical protein AVEN_177383-1 [Araneus ventricosus]GBO07840.1 hypothetical protein AVEN_224562-1 [Araneus ventricosus]